MTLEPSHRYPLTPGSAEAEASSAAASGPVGPPPRVGPSREYRATATFAISGVFILVILLLVGGLLSTAPPIRGVVALLGVVLGLVALFGAALGLGYGRPWAAAIATPMLALMIIGGVIETVVAFTHSSINIPIGALLALWALRAPLRTPPDPTSGRRPWGLAGSVIVGAMLLATVWPLPSALLLSTDGPLIVGKDELMPSLGIRCDGEPGRPPTAIHIKYDWHWSRAEPMVAGSDTVTLTAFSARAFDGQPAYVLNETEETSAGTWQSDILINQPTGIVFGIDLVEARFEPGTVGIGLVPGSTDHQDAHGVVDIKAVYLHGPADTLSADSPAIWGVATHRQCVW